MNEDQNEAIPENEIGEFDCLNGNESNLTFERALALLRQGRFVMRLSNMDDAQEKEIWFGRFLQLCTDIEGTDESGNVVFDGGELIVIRDKDCVHFRPWSPRLDDIMADDWCEVLRDANEVKASTYKSRISDELVALVQKIEKLNTFMDSGKFKEIDKNNRAMLRLQRFVMKSYATILEMRLEA